MNDEPCAVDNGEVEWRKSSWKQGSPHGDYGSTGHERRCHVTARGESHWPSHHKQPSLNSENHLHPLSQ